MGVCLGPDGRGSYERGAVGCVAELSARIEKRGARQIALNGANREARGWARGATCGAFAPALTVADAMDEARAFASALTRAGREETGIGLAFDGGMGEKR